MLDDEVGNISRDLDAVGGLNGLAEDPVRRRVVGEGLAAEGKDPLDVLDARELLELVGGEHIANLDRKVRSRGQRAETKVKVGVL